ncbi:MAG: right-handed parallel beta-helix repeat-containing protein [Cyanobacteria bacterium J06639_14]
MNDFDTSNISSDASSWQQADFDLGLSDQSLLPKTSPNLSSQDSSTLRFAEDDLALNAADNTSLNNDGTLVIEAEDLTLRNYKTKSNKASSNGEYITVRGKRGKGTATGVFNGPAGTYDVVLGYYDESDGKASVDLTVAGDTQSLSFDEDLGSKLVNRKTLTSRTTHTSIELNPGDVLELTGWRNKGEHARIDRIEFVPVGLDPTPEDPGEGGAGDETPVIPEPDTPTNDDIPTDGMPVNDPPALPIDVEDMRVDGFVHTGKGDTFYVSPDGDDANPGTKDQPWKTISYAVSEDSAVGAGDTILVQTGTYTEQVQVEKSGNATDGHINLKADGDVTVIEPEPDNNKNASWHRGVIEIVEQNYWVVDGFRVENAAARGIAARDVENVVIQNNHTYNSGSSGIIVQPNDYFEGGEEEVTSKNVTVINNTLEKSNVKWLNRFAQYQDVGGQEALSMWGVDGFEVAGNYVVEGNREGIDAKNGARNGSIHSNTVTQMAITTGIPTGYNGGPAIYIDGGRSDTFNIDVHNNKVYGNVADGIVVGDELVDQGDVSDIRIYNNEVYDNGKLGTNQGAAIAVNSNVSDVEIFNNTTDGNIQSIVIERSDYFGGDNPSGVIVKNNLFANDKYRFGAVEDANGVTLTNNLFVNDDDGVQDLQIGGGLTNFINQNNKQASKAGFVNSKNKNYRLTASSAAVDAGSNALPNYLTIDKDGNQRTFGSKTDIGAYELITP